MSDERRLLIWRCIMDALRQSHRINFPRGRLFGSDLTLLMVMGAAVALGIEGKHANASKIGGYLELPRETTRRCLIELVRLGLLLRSGGQYIPTQSVVSSHIATVTRLIKKTASQL